MAGRADVLAVEQQLQRDLDQITDEHTRLLLAAWATAWSEVSADLLDTLANLMAGGAKVTAATVVRSARLQSELVGIADRLDELAADAGVTITRDLADVVTQAADGQIALMLAQLAEDDDRVERMRRRTPSGALRAIVERFTERVTSQTQPLADETYDAIQRELVRGVAVGSNPRETARRMVARAEDHWNFGLNRALNIARTETLDAHREAARVEQDRHADVLAGWVWLAHLGPRTCRSCLAMNGRLFPLEVAGPHDHQQGRCSRCPVVRNEDGSADTSFVPDADEHFAGLDRADQVAILGKQGYRAWAAGDFPREQWTKTRSTDGWRDAQVPAAPGDADGGSGLPPTPIPVPGGQDDRTHRERAIAALGQPPADPGSQDGLSYWARRQSRLPIDFQGDTLHGHEVESLERLLDAGAQLRWIPKDRSRPTNDFLLRVGSRWLPVEMKSTLPRYESIHGRIVDSTSRAFRNHGVVKDRFLIDLGDEPLPEGLLEQLADFNVGRRKYLLAALWVMAQGEIHPVVLRK